MRIAKFDDGGGRPAYAAGAGAGQTGGNSGGQSGNLNRTLWGQEDTGGNISEDMFVSGSIYLSGSLDEDGDDGDGDGKEKEEKTFETRAEDEGSNIYMEEGTLFAGGVQYEYGEGRRDLADHQREQDDELVDHEGRLVDHAGRIGKLEALFPIGSILMYAGNIAVPAGWHVCDGTGGTVDLRKKFIRAAESAGTVGTTGGRESVTLTTANMPSHGHPATTTVSLNINNTADDVPAGYRGKLIPAIDRIQEEYYDTGGSSNAIMYTGNKKGDYGLVGIKVEDLVSYAGGATGTATATTTIGNTGSGSSFDIKPPFYDLIFIQRVS